jgi:hypothetical protein
MVPRFERPDTETQRLLREVRQARLRLADLLRRIRERRGANGYRTQSPFRKRPPTKDPGSEGETGPSS